MSCFRFDRKLLLIKIHFFLALAGQSPILPFLSTIAKQRGYSPVIVGLMFTILPVPGLVMRPVAGAITDKYKCRKTGIVLIMIVLNLLVCALSLIPGSYAERELDDAHVIRTPFFWLFITTIVVYNTGCMMRSVLEDTICFGLLGEDKHKYGQQRMWGAIGWGLVSALSGTCVDWFSQGQEYKNYAVGFAIGMICITMDIFVLLRIKVVENEDDKTVRLGSDMKQLFTKIKVQAFIVWIVFFGFFCAIVLFYLFWYMDDLSNIYHPETKPYIKTLQGLSLTIQCFGSEIPMFILSGYVIKRIGHMNVFSLMYFGYAVRFFLYSIIRDPVFVLPVELLHGMTFALAYSAAKAYAAHIAPVGTEGMIQGILGSCLYGIGMPVGSFIAGCLFNKFGSITSFEILSYVAMTVCVTQMIVNQLINRLTKSNNRVQENVRSVELKLFDGQARR